MRIEKVPIVLKDTAPTKEILEGSIIKHIDFIDEDTIHLYVVNSGQRLALHLKAKTKALLIQESLV